MTQGYGQYCPLALAAELLCQRWTILIISRLFDGCTHFNEIHRGLPRISPSLLSHRLAQLERAGLLSRAAARKGSARTYRLTPAGRDLEPLIEGMAVWGQHWGRDMISDDLDPAFLVWSMHRRLDTTVLSAARTVIEFEFSGAPRGRPRFWLLIENGVPEMCLQSPGYEVDLRVSSDLRLFIEAWRGIRDLRHELRARRIRLLGPKALCKQFPDLLKLSVVAPWPRRRSGREQRLAMAARRLQRSLHDDGVEPAVELEADVPERADVNEARLPV